MILTEEELVARASELIEYERLKRDLVVRLKLIEDLTKFKLKQMEDIKITAKHLARVKVKNRFKLEKGEEDIKKLLFKYARY